MLVQPSWLGVDNGQLLAALGAEPRRLRGIAVLDPRLADHDALGAMAAAGVRGLRLNTVSSDPLPGFDEPEWRRLLPAMAALGLHLEIMLPGAAWPAAMPALQRAAAHVPLVFDHFAQPPPDAVAQRTQALLMGRLAAERPLTVKLSAPYNSPGVNHPDWVARLAGLLGSGAFVFASNFPFPRHEAGRDIASERAQVEAAMRAAGLTQPGLSANAAARYGFA